MKTKFARAFTFKFRLFTLKSLALSLALAVWGVSPAKATPLYWDLNGTGTAGGATSGTTTATGTWNSTNTFWNSDPTGGSAGTVTATTTIADDLFFSAGTDVTGTSTVTVSGSQAGNSITVEEGAVSLAGAATPVLTLGSGGITVNSGAALTSASSLTAVRLGASQTWTNIGNTFNFVSATLVSGSANIGSLTLTLDGTNTTSDATRLQMIISNGTGNTLSIVKNGAGTWRFDAQSTYSGGFTLNAGTLDLGTSSTPTSGTVTSGPIGTGTLTLNGGNIQARSASRTIANAVLVGGDFGFVGTNGDTFSGAMNLGGTTRTITAGSTGAYILSGVISNGGLTKSGSGTLTISGSLNAYAGGTTVLSGSLSATTGNLGTGNATLADTTGVILTLANTNAIADSAILSFGNNSIVNLNAASGSEALFQLTDSTNALTLNAANAPGGQLVWTAAQLNTYFGNGGADITSFASASGETITLAVPEPSTWVMLLGGAGALTAFRRLRRRKS